MIPCDELWRTGLKKEPKGNQRIKQFSQQQCLGYLVYYCMGMGGAHPFPSYFILHNFLWFGIHKGFIKNFQKVFVSGDSKVGQEFRPRPALIRPDWDLPTPPRHAER